MENKITVANATMRAVWNLEDEDWNSMIRTENKPVTREDEEVEIINRLQGISVPSPSNSEISAILSRVIAEEIDKEIYETLISKRTKI